MIITPRNKTTVYSLRFLLPMFVGAIIILFSFTSSTSPSYNSLPCIDKKFNVVVHVVRDSFGFPNISEAGIKNKLNTVNYYFSKICISFDICEFRYIDNFQYDTLTVDKEWSQLQIDHFEANRINMYFVYKTDDEKSFATLGGIANLNSGGIVMMKGHGGKVMTHEMGHYFGLLHTFAGAGTPNAELVDGSNCATAGDLVCDTPADPYIEGGVSDPGIDSTFKDFCRYVYMGKDANGQFYNPSVGNIMSYYTQCVCKFTQGQYFRMANTYLNSNPKMW